MSTKADCPHSINLLLVHACRAHRSRANELFSAFGLHVGQDWILRALLEEDGRTLSELAEALGVQPPTVTRMARRMAKNKLIERRKCREDGRVFQVFLTEKGKKTGAMLDEAWARLEAETVQGLSESEQATLAGLLEKLKSNLGSAAEASAEE